MLLHFKQSQDFVIHQINGLKKKLKQKQTTTKRQRTPELI